MRIHDTKLQYGVENQSVLILSVYVTFAVFRLWYQTECNKG